MQATGRKTPTNATPSKVQAMSLSKGKGLIAQENPISKGKGAGKGKSTNVQMQPPRGNTSARAGVHFGVPRIARFMKNGRYTDRIGGGAPVYLAATLQYLCSEILELAGNET